jgi:hypothetical protein
VRLALLKEKRVARVFRSPSGNASLQAIFAIAFFMLLAICVVQVAMMLYARNIVAASAHEGARAAAELGRNPRAAVVVARETIEKSAGRLLEDVDVDATVRLVNGQSIVTVDVSGRLEYPGPIPVSPTLTARASATREGPAR